MGPPESMTITEQGVWAKGLPMAYLCAKNENPPIKGGTVLRASKLCKA